MKPGKSKAEEYENRQEEAGFARGQKVRVMRRAAHGEDGWQGYWRPAMQDDWIGLEAEVCGPRGDRGIEVRERCEPLSGLRRYETFPWFVLQPLTDRYYNWLLKPFTRVLARDACWKPWKPDIFLEYKPGWKCPYLCAHAEQLLALPYQGHEYLLNTDEEPDQLTAQEVMMLKKSFEQARQSEEKHYRMSALAMDRPAGWLAPFTEVLGRQDDDDIWAADIFRCRSGKDQLRVYECFVENYAQCVPYKGNEELLGTAQAPGA